MPLPPLQRKHSDDDEDGDSSGSDGGGIVITNSEGGSDEGDAGSSSGDESEVSCHAARVGFFMRVFVCCARTVMHNSVWQGLRGTCYLLAWLPACMPGAASPPRTHACIHCLHPPTHTYPCVALIHPHTPRTRVHAQDMAGDGAAGAARCSGAADAIGPSGQQEQQQPGAEQPHHPPKKKKKRRAADLGDLYDLDDDFIDDTEFLE